MLHSNLGEQTPSPALWRHCHGNIAQTSHRHDFTITCAGRPPGQGTPLGVLSSEDRWRFFGLQAASSAPETRFNRNRKVATLQEQLQAIRSVSVRNDWRRLQMFGVAILSASTLVINTLALAALVGKSKSSVNETLQKMQ
jgi:hypothetical protein